MIWKEFKAKIKSISCIGKMYDSIYGNKKVQRIMDKKREALHKSGYDLADKIEKELSIYNVKYFIDFGNLLGIIRTGKFINHDLDMDYGIYITPSFTWKDLETALSHIGLRKLSQYLIDGQIIEQTYSYNELTVDFFNHFDDDKNCISYVFFKKDGHTYNSIYERSVSELKMFKFDKTKKLTTEDLTFTIPDEPEKYLASIYTEEWRIPNPNWIAENGPAWHERDDLIGILETFH